VVTPIKQAGVPPFREPGGMGIKKLLTKACNPHKMFFKKGLSPLDPLLGRCSHQNKRRWIMKAMTEFGKLALAICLSFSFASCAVPLVQGEKWLDSKQEKPDINISGNWESPEWGAAVFKQEGGKISGTLGDYPTKGVVSGKYVYLLMYWREKVDYFAKLQAMDNNTLKGSYSQKINIEELNEKDRDIIRPVNLKRVSPSP
jgi:hypothetical protein